MHLSRLYIENYRSVEKLDLQLKRGRNVIVGRNNSGKSNILRAIDLVLGPSSPTWKKSENITENDFIKGEVEREIFIWCELVREPNELINFSEIEGSAIFKVQHAFSDYKVEIQNLSEEREKVFAFCGSDGEALLEGGNYKKYWIGGKSYCKRSFADEFSDKYFFALAFRCKRIENAYEKDLVFLYRDTQESGWIISPNSNLREVLLQSAIIPSFRDPRNQLSVSGWGWYGKLLRRYIKADDPGLLKAFEGVKGASENVFKKLKEKICDPKMNVAFPGTKISFQFNPESKQDIHKSALIYVDDGFNSQLQDKGSGIQSAVIIGLFDFYTREIAHSAGSSLLAIEEPELYLHPHGRRVISERINMFLDDNKNQVILTTHSPEFLSSIEDQNIIVVKKDGVATIAKGISFDSPKRKQILIKKQNAEMFFADAVILVEGADKYFFEQIAAELGEKVTIDSDGGRRLLGKNWINEHNVSVINCGGKTEFEKYSNVLKELRISFSVVADFDFLRRGLAEYLTKIDAEQSLKDKLNSLRSECGITETSGVEKLSQVDSGKQKQVKEYLALLSKNNIFILEGKLENYYKVKPVAEKEQGVIETISKMIEAGDTLSAYLETAEFEEILKTFLDKVLKLNFQK